MRMDILIVEDQRRIAEGLSVMLSSCKEDGIQIERTLIADNGVQALKMLEQQPVDLLITDIRMPIMDGLELMRRCSVQHRDVPFIILSGYDDFKYAQKAIEYGAKAYLLKPVDRAALYAAIRRIDAEKREKGGDPHTARRQLLLHYARGEEKIDNAVPVWRTQKIGTETTYYVAYTQFDGTADLVSDPSLRESLLALTDSRGLILGERDEVLTLCPAQTSALWPNSLPGAAHRQRQFRIRRKIWMLCRQLTVRRGRFFATACFFRKRCCCNGPISVRCARILQSLIRRSTS